MALVDIKSIKTAKELERIARKDLEGKSLAEIMESIKESDHESRVTSKAGVGYVIERGYFGIPRNSTAGPDIEHLGVEVKTSPLKFASGRFKVKEPLSLNIINYGQEVNNKSLKESSLYKKNEKVLFFCYYHDLGRYRSEYKIRYVFLWEIDDEVLEELEPDYLKILEKIKQGKAHEIHQTDHEYLTLCPKHGGKFNDPLCSISKRPQPFSTAPAEVRAFRLKNKYMDKIIRRHLRKERPLELENYAI